MAGDHHSLAVLAQELAAQHSLQLLEVGLTEATVGKPPALQPPFFCFFFSHTHTQTHTFFPPFFFSQPVPAANRHTDLTLAYGPVSCRCAGAKLALSCRGC